MGVEIRLEPWDERALELERAANVPEMKVHLGGVETEQSLLDRHERIRVITRDGKGSMFLVLLLGESRFEYPPGHEILSCDWRYDLRADPSWPS